MSENAQPDHHRLEWPALLAKWVEFAQASVALPHDDDGKAWRASVPPIITLQAVTLALGELNELSSSDQPVAIDKASLLIEREASALSRIWDADIPAEVARLVRDAQTTLHAAAQLIQSRENNIDD